jgi:hypothetical protein
MSVGFQQFFQLEIVALGASFDKIEFIDH